MGSGQSRIVEGSGKENKGFPVCRMTIDLTKLVDSMVAYDKNRIILGARDELQILDYPHKNITPLSKEHKGRINCVIKLSNNEIVTAGQDKTIKVWEINNKSSLMTLSGHTSMIWCLNEISGNKVISGSSDNRAIIWNLNEKKLDFELYKDKEISAVIQLKTGKVLLCSADKLILFDIDSKKPLTNYEIKPGIWCMKELSDGTVAAGYGNGDVGILEIGNEIREKIVLKGHKKTVNSIIELDNHKLVSSSDENNMILWDLSDPEGKYFINGHTNNINCLAHLYGNKFASVSLDKTLKIWE
jgi:WD40 repeat protein